MRGRFLCLVAVNPRVIAMIAILTVCPLILFSTEFPVANSQSKNQESTPAIPLTNKLWNEAEFLRGQQQRESSRQAIEKYLEVSRLCHDNEFAQAAKALARAGDLFQILGEFGNALKAFKDALALSKKAKSDVEQAVALNGLAYVYFLQGDSNAARENSSSALTLARKTGDRSLEATALSNLGESIFSSGDLAAAQKYQEDAYELFKTLGDLRGQAITKVALGYYSANLSEPHQALTHLEDALLSARKVNDVRAQVLALNAMGNIKAKLGRRQEALESYDQAIPLAEQIGDRLSLASIHAGTASLYYWMGDAKRTVEYDQQAVTAFEEIGASWGTAEAKLDLGRATNSLGEHEKAIAYLEEALELFRKMGMKRLEARTLSEIGTVESANGEYVKSIQTFQQAIKLTRDGQDYRYAARSLNLMGNVYEALNDQKQAVQHFDQALQMSRIASDRTAESTALFNLARVDRNNGNLVSAEQKLESALTMAESIRTTVSSQDLRASFFAAVRQIYELYIDVLMLRHKSDPGSGFDVRAFAISERARARSLLESLQEGQANIREGVDASLLQKELSLSETLNAKADRHLKLLAEKHTPEAEQVQKEIDALTVDYDRLLSQIRITSPRYAALTSPEPLNLSQVQQRLIDNDSVLLEYALGDDRSYVWVITNSSFSTYELPSRKDIEDAARQLYSDFTAYQIRPGESVQQRVERQKKSDDSIPVDTQELTKLVLGPLTGKLGKKRLLIVSDGALQYIPFAALHDPDSEPTSPRYLYSRYEIVTEPSASTLSLLLDEARQRSAARDSVAVLADPVFEVDDPRVKRASYASTPETSESLQVKQALRDIGISIDGVQIPRLLASGDEADGIINSAPWGTGLKAVGFEANRSRVLGEELRRYRVVHFATHGIINNEHPELSGIVLSLFDQQGRSQDGFLRLHDIYNLHLPADLVVLSACSTGLGKDVRGEGLIGLTRGFMYAGASGVVASLWKVDDQATAELMKLFYGGMFQKGLAPVAALREAQLQMSQEKAWRSPYYWAGFIIQGRYDEKLGGSQVTYLTGRRIATISLVVVVMVVSGLFLIRRRRRVW